MFILHARNRNTACIYIYVCTVIHVCSITREVVLIHVHTEVCNNISRNRPYIGGHLAFYFKLNSKLSHRILKIDLNVCCYFHCNRIKQCYAKIKARI